MPMSRNQFFVSYVYEAYTDASKSYNCVTINPITGAGMFVKIRKQDSCVK
jgi:hypothetical protein